MPYSHIIDAQKYAIMMNYQHRYISTCDDYISLATYKKAKEYLAITCAELGCGPARITRKIQQSLQNSGAQIATFDVYDIDSEYINFTDKHLANCKTFQQDICTTPLQKKYDIIISQGFHHHISSSYIARISESLTNNGIYLLGDEFICEGDILYNKEEWYNHIISYALQDGFEELAVEEIKTFLDDISTNKQFNTKTQSTLLKIKQHINKGGHLREIYSNVWDENNVKDEMSRGDNKIQKSNLTQQLSNHNLEIVDEFETNKLYGGYMGVYTIKRI